MLSEKYEARSSMERSSMERSGMERRTILCVLKIQMHLLKRCKTRAHAFPMQLATAIRSNLQPAGGFCYMLYIWGFRRMNGEDAI